MNDPRAVERASLMSQLAELDARIAAEQSSAVPITNKILVRRKEQAIQQLQRDRQDKQAQLDAL